MLKRVIGLMLLISSFIIWSNDDEQAKLLEKQRDDKLFEAAEKGDESKVVAAVSQGAHVNARNDDGITALMIAARVGNLPIAEYLVDHDADVNMRNNNGVTALIYALLFGHDALADFFIGRGALLTGYRFELPEGSQPAFQYHLNNYLHRSIYRKNLNQVRAALDLGANINSRNTENTLRYTPLIGAAFRQSLPIIEYLVEHGADVNIQNPDEQTALDWAAFKKDLPTVEYLVEHGARLGDTSFSFKSRPLITALLNRNGDGVNSLLVDPTKLNEEELREALPLAVALNDQNTVDILLRHFGDNIPKKIIERALISAISAHNLQNFERFYRLARRNLSARRFTRAIERALLWAVTRRNEPAVGFILERALVYGEIPDLNVADVGRHVAELLRTRSDLTQDEREALNRIGKSLIAVPRLRELNLAAAQNTALATLSQLMPKLPTELIALILGLTVRPHLPK